VKAPRLREWRLSRGLTQKELSEQAKVSEYTIIRVEKGEKMRPGTARKLAETLGMSVYDLVKDPHTPSGRDEGEMGASGSGGRHIREEVVDEMAVTDTVSMSISRGTLKRALQVVENGKMTSDEALEAVVAGKLL
jgi:DNA-binding XRE family transcriptional regulator